MQLNGYSGVISRVSISSVRGDLAVGRLARWWTAALFFWLWGLMFSEIAAEGIAKTPQSGQATWGLIFRFLPLGPILLALTYATFHAARGLWTRRVALRCAWIALGAGIIVIALTTPKP